MNCAEDLADSPEFWGMVEASKHCQVSISDIKKMMEILTNKTREMSTVFMPLTKEFRQYMKYRKGIVMSTRKPRCRGGISRRKMYAN